MTPEQREQEKFNRAERALMDAGMSREELDTRMTRYRHLELNNQANIMGTMLKMRKGYLGEAFSL